MFLINIALYLLKNFIQYQYMGIKELLKFMKGSKDISIS